MARKSFPWGEMGVAALGAAVGGVLGVLFAPKSGKQNRQAIVQETKKASKAVKKAVASSKKKVAARTSTSKKKITKKTK